MLAPQSADEIKPVVEALRRLDPRLDVHWNPKSFIETPGDYSALGKATPATYAARWEVVLRSKATSLHDDREYTLICRVTECDWISQRYPIMKDKGPYAPLGDWLVKYMQLYDRANGAYQDAMARAWAEHDRLMELDHAADRAGNQEALERVYRERGGGEYWMGGAQGRAAPETLATLYADDDTPLLRTPALAGTHTNGD